MGHIEEMDMVCASFAFIDGLGGPEMVLIFVVVLVLFGGQKLPEFARGLGKTMREFKKAAAGVEDEFKRALEEDERKNATPKLTAAPVEPASTYDPMTDSSSDPAGPEAGVHSPVTDDDVTHGEHPPYDETPTASDEIVSSPAPEPSLAEEPSENKILPPASPPVTPPPSPKPSVPPPASSYPENPS